MTRQWKGYQRCDPSHLLLLLAWEPAQLQLWLANQAQKQRLRALLLSPGCFPCHMQPTPAHWRSVVLSAKLDSLQLLRMHLLWQLFSGWHDRVLDERKALSQVRHAQRLPGPGPRGLGPRGSWLLHWRATCSRHQHAPPPSLPAAESGCLAAGCSYLQALASAAAVERYKDTYAPMPAGPSQDQLLLKR